MKVNIDPTPKTIERPPIEHAQLEAGLLGKLFGTQENGPQNIVGLISLLLLVSVIIVMIKDLSQVIPYMKEISAVLTGILGYLFGRRQ